MLLGEVKSPGRKLTSDRTEYLSLFRWNRKVLLKLEDAELFLLNTMFLQKHCPEGEEREKAQGSCIKQLSYNFRAHLSVWTLLQIGYVDKSLPTWMEAQGRPQLKEEGCDYGNGTGP